MLPHSDLLDPPHHSPPCAATTTKTTPELHLPTPSQPHRCCPIFTRPPYHLAIISSRLPLSPATDIWCVGSVVTDQGMFGFVIETRKGAFGFGGKPPAQLIRRRRYNLIPVESKFKLPCSIIKDKYMMKAQVSSLPTVVIYNVVTPTVEKTNDGFQTVGKKKKRKGKSKSTNGGQFAAPSVKPNVRYEPKATTIAPKKGATDVGNKSKSSSMWKTTCASSKNDNIITSKSYSALNDEDENEEEDVENVYDETANLFPNTKIVGSSSFTAAAG
nr:hypothetical protein [Tanacetum cinerariifolium]